MTRKNDCSRCGHNLLTLSKAKPKTTRSAELHVPCKNELRLPFQSVPHMLCLAQRPRPGDPIPATAAATTGWDLQCRVEWTQDGCAPAQCSSTDGPGPASRALRGSNMIPALLAELGDPKPPVWWAPWREDSVPQGWSPARMFLIRWKAKLHEGAASDRAIPKTT